MLRSLPPLGRAAIAFALATVYAAAVLRLSLPGHYGFAAFAALHVAAAGFLLRALRREARQSERLERQRKQLSDFLVHHSKGSIAAILANASYVEDAHDLPEHLREAARDLHLRARTMNRMLLDLLDVSRGDERRLEPRREPIDLPALVEQVALSMRGRWYDVQTRIDVATFDADAALLRRVLEDLLDNAFKYAPGRPVRVLGRRDGDGGVELRVVDDGPGIPDADRERVFDPHAGRGLGLPFCRLAIEAHGGRIWAEPATPRGSQLCIVLPPRPAPPQSVPEPDRAIPRALMKEGIGRA